MGLVLGPWVLAAILARPAGATTPFVNETADGSANDVAFFTSLALDASGKPHVSYHDATTGDLKYARKSGGVWTIETADGSANNLGLHTSLALDAPGNPHVSYYDFTTGDLKYARKSGGVWTLETADGSVNDVGRYSSLALDASGNPHVSYQDNTTNDLKYARKSGGVWTIETADGSANNLGLETSLALDASGNPHVSYMDITTVDLKYARKSAGVWTRETVDGSGNEVGEQISLALDASGNPHVSYLDLTAVDLKYARKSGGVWTIETADGSANVGYHTSLALDASGNPHVSYLDATTSDLKYARKSGGVWTLETADGSANIVGSFTSLALDAQGNPHVTYADFTTFDLKYANAAVHVVSPLGAVTWAVGSLQNIVWSGAGPVDVLLSVDGGGTYDRVETGVITSPWALRVPHVPTRFARVRIERASPLSTAASDSFFTIDATIALAKFDARVADDASRAIALAWETRPGREDGVRYRVERAASDGGSGGFTPAFAPIHAGVLDADGYVDREDAGTRGDGLTYRLIAVNGLDEEYVLGETALTPLLAPGRDLAVYPNPAPDGRVRVIFRVPERALGQSEPVFDLSVYDSSGRRVTTLARGAGAPATAAAEWDGRDGGSRDVAAGTYWLRLTSGASSVSERIVVVR